VFRFFDCPRSRHSAVWVYEQVAKEIGDKRESEYLDSIEYGNQDVDGAKPFWIEGNLKVSAIEQIAFLKKLYRNQLPFSKEHQRLVKDIMIVELGKDWILRAKTGWNGTIGWWVGWVEEPNFISAGVLSLGRISSSWLAADRLCNGLKAFTPGFRNAVGTK